MTKTFGYCRISTPKQSIDRQVRNILSAYPAAIIIKEAFTGTTVEGRKEFEKLMKAVKAGDTIIFDSISRMSRNASEGFALYQKWFAQGVNLVFLKEPYVNTATYQQAIEKQIQSVTTGDTMTDELMNGITAAINTYMMRLAEKQVQIAFDQAEKEVSDLRQRTKEGIETARLAGKQIGQQDGRKLNVKKANEAKAVIRTHSKDFGGTLNDVDCIKLAGCSRNSYYLYKRQLKEDI